jgi:hypothetical protein
VDGLPLENQVLLDRFDVCLLLSHSGDKVTKDIIVIFHKASPLSGLSRTLHEDGLPVKGKISIP